MSESPYSEQRGLICFCYDVGGQIKIHRSSVAAFVAA
jgi:hypothetical protein